MKTQYLPHGGKYLTLKYKYKYQVLHLWLILRKIFKTVATRWQIFRLKYTKFVVAWGSAPDPAGGAYSAPPNPL